MFSQGAESLGDCSAMELESSQTEDCSVLVYSVWGTTQLDSSETEDCSVLVYCVWVTTQLDSSETEYCSVRVYSVWGTTQLESSETQECSVRMYSIVSGNCSVEECRFITTMEVEVMICCELHSRCRYLVFYKLFIGVLSNSEPSFQISPFVTVQGTGT